MKKKNINYALYEFLYKFLRLDVKISVFTVDFSRPWWVNLFHFPLVATIVLFSEIVQAVFAALIPVFIGFAFDQKNLTYFFYFGVVYLALEIMNRFVLHLYQTKFSIIQYNMNLSAYQFFLTVDPVYHSTKSTGMIQSKISAAGREFSSLMSVMLFQLLPLAISLMTVVVGFFYFAGNLGSIALVFFVIASTVSVVGNKYIGENLTDIYIEQRDKFQAKLLETLQQNAYIRSTFGTIEQLKSLENIGKKAFATRTTMVFGGGMMNTLSRSLYILAFVIIGWQVFDLVDTRSLPIGAGISILLTFVNSSSSINRVGDLVSGTVESIINLNDLWRFISNFGKQTFPVLPEDVKTDES
jgi:ABC-type multidrug transport system fused ATPase/permease subunit